MKRFVARTGFATFFMFLCAAIFGARPVLAQLEASCPALVVQALEEADRACAGLGRNSACYGYNQVSATFNQVVDLDFFTAPSDRGDLNLFQSIRTAVLDTLRQQWGIAFLNVQALVPDSLPGQGVIFVLLGDADISNEVSPQEAFELAPPVEVIAQTTAIIRSLPSANANARGEITPGDVLAADGLSADRLWVRVVKGDVAGWIERSGLADSAALDGLPVLTDELRTPMQAFRFRTGIGRVGCEEAPDALIVQGPENLTVNLSANGANIILGSTIVLRTVSDVDSSDVLPGHTQAAQAVAFSLDGQTVVTGDTAGVLRLWMQAGGSLLRTWTGHEGEVMALAFAPDGELITAGSDGSLRWWDAASGVEIRTVATGAAVNGMAVSPTGDLIATIGADDVVRLWNARTGEPAGDVSLNGVAITALAFSPTGDSLALGGVDGSLYLWNVTAGTLAENWDAHSGAVRALAFHPEARFLVSGGDDAESKVWALPSGDLRLALPTGPVNALSLSSNGYTLAVGGPGRDVELWDAEGGGRQAVLSGHQGSIEGLAYSEDGMVLASGANDTTARLWRLAPRAMELITLDGYVVVDGVHVPPGYRSIAPLGSDGLVSGRWSPPTPVPVGELMDLALLTTLTDSVLHYPITLPLTSVAAVPTPTPTPAPSSPFPLPPTPASPAGPSDDSGSEPPCGVTAFVGDNESFTGTDCDDVIDGSDGSNSIIGGAGADLIRGYGGDDFLEGGDGDDTLEGGDGNDTLEGDSGFGRDLLRGGAGDDLMYGGPGDDTLEGGDGNDTLYGDDDDDTLDGGAGDDLIDGGSGNDQIVLGDDDGVDTVYAGDGDDTITIDGEQTGDYVNSGTGNDHVQFGPELSGELTIENDENTTLDFSALLAGIYVGNTEGPDPENPFPYIASGPNFYILLQGIYRHIIGTDYDDELDDDWLTEVDNLLDGRGGDDFLFSHSGNDTLLGGTGNDTLIGGVGNHLLDGGDGDDIIEDYEFEPEMAGQNTLYGRGGNDQLFSGAGNDLLDGGDGHDLLVGGEGADTLLGGDGDDELHDDYWFKGGLTQGPAQLTEGQWPLTGQFDDYLDGGDGDDRLFSDYGNDTLIGGAGNDSLYSWAGDDLLLGGDGDDFLVDYTGNNIFNGGAGNDTIWDGDGNDTIYGGDGDDVIELWGDGSADYVDAGAGNDTLYLWYLAANDTLTGGTGKNLFVFDVMTGSLTIESQGDDTLDFSAFGETPVNVDLSIQDEAQEVAPNFWLTLRGMFAIIVGEETVSTLTTLANELQPMLMSADVGEVGAEDGGTSDNSVPDVGPNDERDSQPVETATSEPPVVMAGVETTPEPAPYPETTPEIDSVMPETTPEPMLDATILSEDAGGLGADEPAGAGGEDMPGSASGEDTKEASMNNQQPAGQIVPTQTPPADQSGIGDGDTGESNTIVPNGEMPPQPPAGDGGDQPGQPPPDASGTESLLSGESGETQPPVSDEAGGEDTASPAPPPGEEAKTYAPLVESTPEA